MQRQQMLIGAQSMDHTDYHEDEETAEVVEDMLLQKIHQFGELYQYGSPD